MSKVVADVLSTAFVMDAPMGGSLGVVEMLQALAQNTKKIAHAITADASPCMDATGGSVGCLTEAMVGNTAGLIAIAHAIGDLAEAIREHGGSRP